MTTWHVSMWQYKQISSVMRRRRTITPEWQQSRHLMVTSPQLQSMYGHQWSRLLCSGPAPTVMRHWHTRHADQYSVFRQTPENQQQQHDRQGYPRPRLCPSWSLSRDWSGQRLKCVSPVSQPFWCDPLEVSRIHCVRINHSLPKSNHEFIFKHLDMRTQTSLPCTPMM